MLVELIILFVTTLVGYFVYEHMRAKDKFRKAGLCYLPGVPAFGNAYGTLTGRRHMIEDLDAVYRQFPDEKYVGYIEGTRATILVRDPEVIKMITVKEFDHFVDHRQFISEDIEPMFGGSVFFMKGERWRHMRTTLTPAFTGSKMRHMVPFMSEISNNIITYLKENHKNDVLDITDVIRRYMNDVIASAGFGIVVNSLIDRNNEFYTLGQGVFSLNTKQRILLVFCNLFPRLAKTLGLKVLPEKTTNFFRDVVKTTMEYREKNKVERPDMIQLLMEASKGKLTASGNENDNVGFAVTEDGLKTQGTNQKNIKWTDDELAAQVFTFFVAGFDTSSHTMILCLHELALNPDIQERLYQEVREFKEKNGAVTFDKVGELKYMDCVLNETLRKWAPAIIMDRICAKDYVLQPPHEGGKPYKVKKGDMVYNVVNSIHMDPQYYPDPEKFDPDRFSDENKHLIKPFTFMPFGIGPRACIGMRFAILELKVLLFDLVSNFKILKCEKTRDPIVLVPSDVNLRCEGGSFVKLQMRENA